MSHTIVMPALSAGMEEGTIARWLKAVGDSVAPGDIVAEIETDKATMEYEAERAGVIGKIVAAEGETVPVNGAIALLLTDDEQLGDRNAQEGDVSGVLALATPAKTVAVAGSSLPSATSEDVPRRAAASPLARRIAQIRGIALDGLKGSGFRGRIVRIDIDAASASAKAQTPSAAPAATGGTSTTSQVAPALVTSRPDAQYEEVPLSGVRKVIARRLTDAKRTIPHFDLSVDCEIDALLELRGALNCQGNGAYKLSVNDFVIKAAALALRQVPQANAAWAEDAILLFRDIDISVAVATDGGLITPIVREADRKGLSVISSEIKALAGRAREGRLQPAEYPGGGFTVSNLGMYGVRAFSAIINPPQSCILAVGAAERRAVVRGDLCVPATMMSCTLFVDHRSVDGAIGARYLGAFKALIEQPLHLML